MFSVSIAGSVLDEIDLIENAVGIAIIVVEAANYLQNGGEHDVVVTWTPDPAIEPCLISVSPTVRDFPIATTCPFDRVTELIACQFPTEPAVHTDTGATISNPVGFPLVKVPSASAFGLVAVVGVEPCNVARLVVAV